MLQHDVRFRGVHGIDRISFPHPLHGDDGDAPFAQQRLRDLEGCAEDDGACVDHPQDHLGVARPRLQIGPRGGLVQHRHTAAAHPHRLADRGDVHGLSCEDTHRVAGADTCGSQGTGHTAGLPVDQSPVLPQRRIRFAGDQSPGVRFRRRIHLLGESAHDPLLVRWCTTSIKIR